MNEIKNLSRKSAGNDSNKEPKADNELDYNVY